MSFLLETYLPKVRAIDASESALVFRKIYNACDELSYLQTFLVMADKTGTEIEVSAVPAIIRQTARMINELYDAYVLLCPVIDEGCARNQLTEAGIIYRKSPSRLPFDPQCFPKEK